MTSTVRQQRLRDEIIREAITLFRARGFDNTSVGDVAEIVGISPRSFFRYFRSKEDLAFGWLTTYGDLVRDLLIADQTARSPYAALETALLAYAADRDRLGDLDRFLLAMIFENPALHGRFLLETTRWAEAMAALTIGEGDFGARAQALAASAAFNAAQRAWASDGDERPLSAWARQAFAAARDGAATMLAAPAS